MDICSHNHSEIAYTDRTCPLCDLHTDFAQLRSEYEALESEIYAAEEPLSTAYSKYQRYHSILADIAPEHLL